MKTPVHSAFCSTLLLSAFAAASLQSSQASVSRQFTHTYPIKSNGTVELRGINGSVTIAGWSESAVEVHATLHANDDENLTTMAVQVQATPDGVAISNDQPGGLMQNASETVDYVIHVPFACQLKHVEVMRSSLSIERVTGPMRVRVVSGDISVRDVVTDCDLEVVEGQIDAALAQMAPRGRFHAKTTTGRCTVSLPETSDAVVTADTTFGSIRNDFDGKRLDKNGRHLGGAHDGGAASIGIESILGNIVVRKNDDRR